MTFTRVNYLMSGYGRTTSTPLFLPSFSFRLVPQLSFLIDPLPEIEMSVYFFFFFSQLAQHCPEIDPNAPKDTPVEAPQTATETLAEQHVCLWHL